MLSISTLKGLELVSGVTPDPIQVLSDSGKDTRIPGLSASIAERHDTEYRPFAVLVRDHERTPRVTLTRVFTCESQTGNICVRHGSLVMP